MTSPPPDAAGKVVSISVTPSASTVNVGQTVTLVATALDASGNTVSTTFHWASSDTTLALVSDSGTATAIAGGQPVTVTVTSDGTMGSTTLQLRAPPPGPGETTVQVAVDSSATQINPEDLRLSAGLHGSELSVQGVGSADVSATSAQLLTASTKNGTPVLFAISPGGSAPIALSAASTAAALAFLNPALVTSASDSAATILAAIRSSTAYQALESLVAARLAASPTATFLAQDSALAQALGAVVDDVVRRVGSPRQLARGASIRPLTLVPTGTSPIGGVSIAVGATAPSGAPVLQLTNSAARWAVAVMSYSNDGMTYTSSDANNGSAFLPTHLLAPYGLSLLHGLSGGSTQLTATGSAPYAAIKIFGLGFADGGGCSDPDCKYNIAPIVLTPLFNIGLPVLEVITGLHGLRDLADFSDPAGAWAKWLGLSTSCASNGVQDVTLVANTLQNLVKSDLPQLGVGVGLCFLKEFMNPSVGGPIVASLVGASAGNVAQALLSNLFPPFKILSATWSITKNSVNLVLAIDAVSQLPMYSTYPLRDPALVVPASVTVTPLAPSLSIGSTLQLQAAVLDSNGAGLAGRSVSWASESPTIATVDRSGLVTPVAPGTATIRATDAASGKSAVSEVQVLAFTPQPSAAVTAASLVVHGDQARLSVDVVAFDQNGNGLQSGGAGSYSIAPLSYGNGTLSFAPVGDSVTAPHSTGPLTTVLVIDQSGSMTSTDPTNARLAAATAYAGTMNPGDQVAVYLFADNATRLVDFTSDPQQILIGLSSPQSPTGGTRLYDTAIDACSYALSGVNKNRNVILLTDGQDNESSRSVADVIAGCSAQGVKVSTIGFGASAPTVLATIAEGTGGLAAASLSSRLPTERTRRVWQSFPRLRGAMAGNICRYAAPGRDVSFAHHVFWCSDAHRQSSQSVAHKHVYGSRHRAWLAGRPIRRHDKCRSFGVRSHHGRARNYLRPPLVRRMGLLGLWQVYQRLKRDGHHTCARGAIDWLHSACDCRSVLRDDKCACHLLLGLQLPR